ncbi:hypothetical protein B0H34DRAFT_169053 [Crassisporium funariophilum]|nr:hypothetical protein B0H34DRAFT_169053 [Crassisporium funariophilum]
MHQPQPHQWYSHDLFQLVLPLESSTVNFFVSSDEMQFIPGLINYILLLKHSLVSLSVKRPCFTIEHIDRLTSSFSSSLLRKLELRVRSLTPLLLQKLASNLPNLDTLTLSFFLILAQDGAVGNPYNMINRWNTQRSAELFPQAMEMRRRQSAWIFRDCFNTYCQQQLDCGPHWPACKRALVEAMPNAKIFCGLPPEEFVVTDWCWYRDGDGRMPGFS